jgi:hypothetical protein
MTHPRPALEPYPFDRAGFGVNPQALELSTRLKAKASMLDRHMNRVGGMTQQELDEAVEKLRGLIDDLEKSL